MALPPNIPTSFVPYSASSATRRFRADYGGALAFFGYGVLVVVIALAVAVFLYSRVLSATQASKDAALQRAESQIDPTTVESFLQLRDRLSSGEGLLNNHVAFSGFFSALGTIMPSTVRMSSLELQFDTAKAAQLQASGIAKNFNALAALSNAFAADGRIKDAIFSRIVVNPNGTVSFQLAATLDPKLVAFSVSSSGAAPAATPAETATTTASSTP